MEPSTLCSRRFFSSLCWRICAVQVEIPAFLELGSGKFSSAPLGFGNAVHEGSLRYGANCAGCHGLNAVAGTAGVVWRVFPGTARREYWCRVRGPCPSSASAALKLTNQLMTPHAIGNLVTVSERKPPRFRVWATRRVMVYNLLSRWK